MREALLRFRDYSQMTRQGTPEPLSTGDSDRGLKKASQHWGARHDDEGFTTYLSVNFSLFH